MPWKKSEPMDQRREFALKALGTVNFRALCQEYGISAKTGYKWRERFLRQGLEGMEEDSRRPRSSPKIERRTGVRHGETQAGASTLAAEVQLSYPGMATRLVDKNGKLNWKNQKVFLTGSPAGWEVGLQRTEKGQLEIWVGRLLLGHLDPQELDFLRSQEAS